MALKLRKVKYDKKGHIAYVTIDNAEHENCLEEVVDQDLWKVWHDFRDDQNLSVAILTGAGRKSFCAGSDLRWVRRDDLQAVAGVEPPARARGPESGRHHEGHQRVEA